MRDIIRLHPTVQILATKLVKMSAERGLKIKVTDCVRTKSEQNILYAQGRSTPGNIVTNVNYPNSNHCWGMAFDICRADGKGSYNNQDGFFQKVGSLGKSIGLTWGGDWKSFVDLPHFQLDLYGNWSELKEKYGTPEMFFASWKGNPYARPITTVKETSSKNDVAWLQWQLNHVVGSVLQLDGKWGYLTFSEVYRYQESLGWKPTGYAGIKTISALTEKRTS